MDVVCDGVNIIFSERFSVYRYELQILQLIGPNWSSHIDLQLDIKHPCMFSLSGI